MIDSTTRDGLLLALGALLVYTLLGQESFYKIDGEYLLWMDRAGLPGRGYHTFYALLNDGFSALCAPLGLTEFETARAMSAVGTAVGALWLHVVAARRFGLSRGESVRVTALVVLCPAWMFFATIVEVHGPFLPFAALGLHALTALVQRPSDGRALVVGMLVGVAFLAHPTGLLLPVVLPVLARLSGSSAAAFRLCRHGMLVCVGVATVVLTVPRLLTGTGVGAPASQVVEVLLGTSWGVANIGLWLHNTWSEWLVPYAPLSFIVVLAVVDVRLRTAVVWLFVALVPYLFVALLLIPHGGEYGAYLLPLAWPIALICAPVFPRPSHAIIVCAVAAAIGTARIVEHDDPEPPRAYAEGFRALAGDDPMLVIGHQRDFAAHFLHLHDLPLVFVGDIVLIPDAASGRHFLRAFDREVGDKLDGGGAVFLSADTIQNLEIASRTGKWPLTADPYTEMTGNAVGPRLLREHLAERYLLSRVESAGFVGTQLRRR